MRELQNVVERAVIATNSTSLQAPSSDVHSGSSGPTRTLAEVERDHILETLRAIDWVIGGWNGAAARLGLPRTTLIARMQRLGLSRESRPRRGSRSTWQRHTANAANHGGDADPNLAQPEDPQLSVNP